MTIIGMHKKVAILKILILIKFRIEMKEKCSIGLALAHNSSYDLLGLFYKQ